jgi:hypothetical protein
VQEVVAEEGCAVDRDAAIVVSESASCSALVSPPNPLSAPPLLPIKRPAPTEALERTSAAMPAARLVIQKMCGPTEAAPATITRPR